MTAAKPRRFEEIDILKAIGIICMVAGHCGAPFTRFVFLFHMALFFIASGFTCNPKSSDSLAALGKTFLKKIRRLWLPFFLSGTFFTLLNNWLIRVNILTDNPELFNYTGSIQIMNLSTLAQNLTPGETLKAVASHFLFLGTSLLTNALWFLRVLFIISMMYAVFDWLIKKFRLGNTLVWQAAVSVLLLGAGYYCHLHQIEIRFGLQLVASYYVLFFLGTLLRRYAYIYAGWQAKQHILALCFSFAVLIALYFFGSFWIGLALNNYPDPFTLLAASMAGWIFCYSLACLLKQTPLKRPLTMIGKRTMSILIFHVLAFKIVNAVIIAVRHLPAFCLAARPHLYGDSGGWWIAFMTVGIACPLLLQLLYEGVKKSFVLCPPHLIPHRTRKPEHQAKERSV